MEDRHDEEEQQQRQEPPGNLEHADAAAADSANGASAAAPGGDAEASSNALYDLLRADMMGAPASLAAGLQDMSLTRGPPEPLQDPAAENAYRNGSSLLRQNQVYRDVYRSVTAIDHNAQRNMGLAGAEHLDRPFEPLSTRAPGLRPEPKPRAFSRVPVSPSHVYVRQSFAELVTTVESLFQALELDAAYEDADCEWRGVAYPACPGEATHFAIHVNSMPNVGPHNYLLEFIRLNGCAIAFFEVFGAVQRAFFDAQVVTNADGDVLRAEPSMPRSPLAASTGAGGVPRPLLQRGTSASALGALPLDAEDYDDDDDDLEPVEVDDAELFRPIVEMCTVPYVDTHVQGIGMAASEATKDALRFFNAAPASVRVLCERLDTSGNSDVRRLACAALGAFAAHTECLDELLAAEAPKILARLAAASASVQGIEAQRQAAEALAALAAHPAARQPVLEAVSVFQTQFDSLNACGDRRITKCIADVRQALLHA